MHGSGIASRDWLHVEDTARAITAALNAPIGPMQGEAINVATGVDVPVLEIAERILDALGKPRTLIEFIDDRQDNSRLSCQIDFTDALAGLRVTVAPDE